MCVTGAWNFAGCSGSGAGLLHEDDCRPDAANSQGVVGGGRGRIGWKGRAGRPHGRRFKPSPGSRDCPTILTAAMSTNTSDNKALHLPDLWIKGFRGIKDLKISRLGHVTLFAGKNGAGKTTVLDAVRVYAARGRNSILMDILGTREELVQTVDEDGDQVFTSNWEALFFGRHISYGTFISIGSIDNMDTLAIDTTPMEEVYEVWEDLLPDYIAEEDVHILRVKYGDNEMTFPSTLLASQLPGARSWRQRNRMRSISTEKDLPPAILCASLGPSLLNNQNIKILGHSSSYRR